jgi:hypothetical protein
MPDVNVNDYDWGNLSSDDQGAITGAVSQTFGYNVVPSGDGTSMAAMESANTATPTGSNPGCEGDCQTMKGNCLSICQGMQDPKCHDACVTACWASYGICLLQCAAGI